MILSTFKKLFLSLFFIFQFSYLYSFNLSEYIKLHNEDSTTNKFLDNFPYQEYIKDFQIDNFREIEQNRKELIANNIDGDEFIVKVFEIYIKNYDFDSIPLTELSALIQTGIFYMNLDHNLVQSYIYNDVGDFILQESTHYIEQSINNNILKISNQEVNFIIEKLKQNNYYVNYSLSDTQKIILHIKSANIKYLWKKFKDKFNNNKYLYLSILICLLLIITLLIIKRKKL